MVASSINDRGGRTSMKKVRYSLMLATGLLLVLFGCDREPSAADAARQNLLGKWSGPFGSKNANESISMDVEFLSDGSCMVFFTDTSTVLNFGVPSQSSSKWKASACSWSILDDGRAKLQIQDDHFAMGSPVTYLGHPSSNSLSFDDGTGQTIGPLQKA